MAQAQPQTVVFKSSLIILARCGRCHAPLVKKSAVSLILNTKCCVLVKGDDGRVGAKGHCLQCGAAFDVLPAWVAEIGKKNPEV